MDKVLVKVYVPMLEKIYDVWIPSHKRIYNVIDLFLSQLNLNVKDNVGNG